MPLRKSSSVLNPSVNRAFFETAPIPSLKLHCIAAFFHRCKARLNILSWLEARSWNAFRSSFLISGPLIRLNATRSNGFCSFVFTRSVQPLATAIFDRRLCIVTLESSRSMSSSVVTFFQSRKYTCGLLFASNASTLAAFFYIS